MMNFPKVLVFAALSARCALCADVYVTNLVARQNWPWNSRVSIDFTLVADAPTDIDLTATHAGGTIDLSVCGLDKLPISVEPGHVHFEWDPAAAGYDCDLRDFAVSVNPSAVDRSYIVFDLASGSHEYLSEPPSGGWTQEHKTSKMVFRRIPASTFTMGIDLSLYKTWVGFTSNREVAHTVKLSHDYYMAVFPLTVPQYDAIAGSQSNASTPSVKTISYNSLRGSAVDGWNWPVTGHTVADNSFLHAVRNRFGGSILVDLPTEAQWEWAARAGASGVWYATDDFPGGGTVAELGTWGGPACTNLVDSIAVWRGNGSTSDAVGQLLPNRFGLYDCCGMVCEWCLDQGNISQLYDSVDPLGASAAVSASDAQRQRRGGPSYNSFGQDITLVRRYSHSANNSTIGVRLCIHVVPAVK